MDRAYYTDREPLLDQTAPPIADRFPFGPRRSSRRIGMDLDIHFLKVKQQNNTFVIVVNNSCPGQTAALKQLRAEQKILAFLVIQDEDGEWALSLVIALAKASGGSVPYIYQIENGKQRNPSGQVLKHLAAVLGTTMAELVGSPLVVSQDAVRRAPASLWALARKKGKQLDLRQEDLEMLSRLHFRGKQPRNQDDWERIFLFLKRILG